MSIVSELEGVNATETEERGISWTSAAPFLSSFHNDLETLLSKELDEKGTKNVTCLVEDVQCHPSTSTTASTHSGSYEEAFPSLSMQKPQKEKKKVT